MTGSSRQGAVPVGADERSTLLDALRGYALLGILIANMIFFTGFFFMDDAARSDASLGRFTDFTEFLIEWLIVGKFYSIFSLLFGIGFAIQIGRLEQRGEGVPRYLRRLFFLFLIGVAHLYLLWMGDIVALYALMGTLLLLFRKASDRALLRWAVVLWLIPIAWSAAMHFGGLRPAAAIFARADTMIAAAGIDISRGPLPAFADPDIMTHLRSHPGEVFYRIGDLVYQMRFTKVLAMFLVGLWVGRRAIYSNLDAYRPLLRRVAIVGIGAGLPLAALKAVLVMTAGEDRPLQFAAELAYVLSTPTLALGYAAGFALLWAKGRRRLLEWAAPAGRMALTNYLMQSLINSLIFLGWGFGLIGTLGLAWILPLSLVIFAFQVAYSRLWLASFRFGPVEWLWRSLTYGTWQPMRRAAARAAVTS